MRKPVSNGMRYAPKLSTRFEAPEIKEPAMEKISTAAAQKIEKVEGEKLTIGLDLGDRSNWYCVLDETGEGR
jgi:hypothetical protein